MTYDLTQTDQDPMVAQREESSALDGTETTVSPDAGLISFQNLQTKMTHLTASIAFSLGIGETDLLALVFIANAGGATPKQAGNHLMLSSGAVNNLIDRMVAADLAQRVPHPNDRRSLLLILTPAGMAAVGSIAGLFRRAFTDSVGPESFAPLAVAFDAIGDSLTRTAEAFVGLAQTRRHGAPPCSDSGGSIRETGQTS